MRVESVSQDLAGTASSLNSDLIPSIDTSIYRYGSTQISGTWTGTVSVQGSNDNNVWVTIAANNLGAANQQFTTAITTNGLYAFPIAFRYLRIRATAWSGGTAVANCELYSLPAFPTSLGVAITQQGTLSVGASSLTGSTVPAAAHYVGILGQDGNLIGLRSAEVDSVTVGSLRTTPYLYDGNKADRARSLSKIKNIYANTVGNTALWTPTSGKKFRLLACRVTATANIAVAGSGVLDVRLFDGSTTSIGLSHSLFCPATAASAPGSAYDSGWMDLRNGYISLAADNVLNINLSLSLTAGGVQTIVVGTEE